MRACAALLAAAVLTGAAAPPAGRAAIIGAAIDYRVESHDSLASLAGRFGVDASTIARRNGLKRGSPLTPGVVLRIDAVHIVPQLDVPVLINVPQRLLFVSDAGRVWAFPVAVGRAGWETPRGAFTVDLKEENPTWDVPPSIQAEMRREGKTPVEHVPPSPANPLGAYWIGLSLPGIGIHGTNAPRSIYSYATHGCIRVHPDRIAELFALMPEGGAGAIVYQPMLVASAEGRAFVEIHPDPYRRSPVTLARLRELIDDTTAAGIDWTRAAEAVRLREGVAVDISKACAPR